MDDESFDALPPYPGMAFPNLATPGVPVDLEPVGGPPGPAPARVRGRLLAAALGAGAVVLLGGAFLLGRGTAHTSGSGNATATALSALVSATPVPGGGGCVAGTPRRAVAGTLQSVSGTTLTVTGPRGAPVTVMTDSQTKVTKVVKAAASDVTVGATVAVHGTAGTAAGTAGTAGTAGGTAAIAADQVAVLPAGGPGLPAVGPRAGAGAGRGVAAGLAVGTVKSVTSSGFTVTMGTTTVDVTTTSNTVYSKTVPAGVGDLTVGQPVVAAGTPNSDGSITATTIGQANSGLPFGRLPGLGFGPGFGPGSGSGHGLGPVFGPGGPRSGAATAPSTTVPSRSP